MTVMLAVDITPISLGVLSIGLTLGGLTGRFKIYPVATLLALIFIPLAFVAPPSDLTLASWILGIFFAALAIGNYLSSLHYEMKETMYMLMQQIQALKAELDYSRMREK